VKISDRISRELDDWLRQNNILYVLDNEITDVFSKELGLMDDKVKEFEGKPVNGILI
jgi:phage antirepressor YoqD-like protein